MIPLSGERLAATYRLRSGDPEGLARAVAVEQTVEFPPELLPPEIRREVVGRLESLEPAGEGAWEARITYPVEACGRELHQVLNLLLGNASLLPGVRLVGLELPSSLLSLAPGPRLGVPGLRERLGVRGRPLVGSALKPMGLEAGELAAQAAALARGGLDLVKDDHGLADQPLSRFAERVRRVGEAVAGQRCLYLPNVTAPHDQVLERAEHARAAGAGGVVVSPGLCGWGAVPMLAGEPSLDLAVLVHPALTGGLVIHPDSGMDHGVLYGTLARLAGADGVIFPHHGGRFAFSPGQCRAIARACAAPLGGLAPSWPVPAGGITLDRVPEVRRFYGDDAVLLVGGDLHRGPLEDRARALVEAAGGPPSPAA